VEDRVFSMAKNDGDNPDSIDDLCVIRAILSLVRKQRFFVRIPYARRITMENLRNRRNPIMLLDMIRSFASLDSTGGSQSSKILRSEKHLIDTMISMKIVDYTISDLHKWMGFSHQHLFRILHSRNDHDRNRRGGLLSKCPALIYIDTTITDETVENVRRKRDNHYTFSQELYQCWNRVSSVWLDTDPKRNEDPDGPAPTGDGRGMIGCSYGLRLKDAEMTANGNPALLIQDNSTNGTIITRESESMCGTTIPVAVCAHETVFSYSSGAMGDDNSKTKIIGENQKIPAPGGNLLNPNLNPTITQPGKRVRWLIRLVRSRCPVYLIFANSGKLILHCLGDAMYVQFNRLHTGMMGRIRVCVRNVTGGW